jgi:hypothetical protein
MSDQDHPTRPAPEAQAELLAALRALPTPASASPSAGLRALALVERWGEALAVGLAAVWALGVTASASALGPLALGLPCVLLAIGPGLAGAGLAALLARAGRVSTSRGLLVLLSISPALLASQLGCPMDGWLHALAVHLGATLVLGFVLHTVGRQPAPA